MAHFQRRKQSVLAHTIRLFVRRPVRVRRSPQPVSGKILVDHFERITAELTVEDIRDLERISREHGQAQ